MKFLSSLLAFRLIGRGQGTRPRPVGDAGSVSWRSGQNSVKRIANKEFWAPQEDLS